MDGQAELLLGEGLGRAGRECGALSRQGTPCGDRWTSGVARVGDPGGTKRQEIDIIADSVQFLGSREDTSGGGGFAGNGASQGGEIPVDERDFQPAPVGASAGDDDIPFYSPPTRAGGHRPRAGVVQSEQQQTDHSEVDRGEGTCAASRPAGERSEWDPVAAGASPANTVATRLSRSTTRMSCRCVSSSPRRARSARGGSRARAAVTKARSRLR